MNTIAHLIFNFFALNCCIKCLVAKPSLNLFVGGCSKVFDLLYTEVQLDPVSIEYVCNKKIVFCFFFTWGGGGGGGGKREYHIESNFK